MTYVDFQGVICNSKKKELMMFLYLIQTIIKKEKKNPHVLLTFQKLTIFQVKYQVDSPLNYWCCWIMQKTVLTFSWASSSSFLFLSFSACVYNVCVLNSYFPVGCVSELKTRLGIWLIDQAIMPTNSIQGPSQINGSTQSEKSKILTTSFFWLDIFVIIRQSRDKL